MCPECGTRLSQSWSWKELCDDGRVSCKNCGMLNVFNKHDSKGCDRCYLPVLGFHSRKDVRSVYGGDFYHDFCYQVVKQIQEKERMLAEQKQQAERLSKTGGGCII